MKVLRDKRILYGITGSIAAYKAVDVIRRLKEEGAFVNCVMTKSALNFVSSLTVEAACDIRVYTDLYDHPMAHIRIPEESDIFVIAPATANMIGKHAAGIADDLMSSMLLAYSGKIIMAPAMNHRMYENNLLQRNIAVLKKEGVIFIEPDMGALACGSEGKGRLADTSRIIDSIKTALTKKDLKGHRIVITAGPTRESIDPVRFISNRSSGKMGYALAEVAKRRGAEVRLISGPVSLTPPYDVFTTFVETAEEMYDRVLESVQGATILIMVAAVADYFPSDPQRDKMKKLDKLTLELKKTKDILESVAALPSKPFTVGFAAQTGPDIEAARTKLQCKGVDLLVFNDVSEPGAGFNVDTNRVRILHKQPEHDRILPLMSKEDLSYHILDYIIEQHEHNR